VLPSAASLVAAFNGAAAGVGVRFIINNTSTPQERITLQMGDQMTNVLGHERIIRSEETGEFMILFTDVTPGSEACDFYTILSKEVQTVVGTEDTNTVTLDPAHYRGLISVPSPGPLAAGGVYDIVCTHAGSKNRILVSVVGYDGVWDGTEGLPVVSVADVSSNSEFTIKLMNAHHTNPFADEPILISFYIFAP
jgi:hypothetical protein